jgi:hypothetical protein
MMAALGLTPAAAQQSGARPRPSILQPLQDPILQLCASAAFQTLVQQQVAGSSVPRHPTGRERMGSPTLQPLQDPILQLCFRGFPNPSPATRLGVVLTRTPSPVLDSWAEPDLSPL